MTGRQSGWRATRPGESRFLAEPRHPAFSGWWPFRVPSPQLALPRRFHRSRLPHPPLGQWVWPDQPFLRVSKVRAPKPPNSLVQWVLAAAPPPLNQHWAPLLPRPVRRWNPMFYPVRLTSHRMSARCPLYRYHFSVQTNARVPNARHLQRSRPRQVLRRASPCCRSHRTCLRRRQGLRPGCQSG